MLFRSSTAGDEHHRVGRHVATLGIDRLVAVGEHADALVAGARDGGLVASATSAHPTKDDVARVVHATARAGDTVLVKASRGLALDTVAEQILSAGPAEPDTSHHPDDSEDRP